jgi:hypothetical protein
VLEPLDEVTSPDDAVGLVLAELPESGQAGDDFEEFDEEDFDDEFDDDFEEALEDEIDKDDLEVTEEDLEELEDVDIDEIDDDDEGFGAEPVVPEEPE